MKKVIFFLQLSSATWLFTENHVHFTTPDHVSFTVTLATVDINQICPNSCSYCLNKNTVNVPKIWTPFLFLQNAYKCSCSPRTYVVKVVPEALCIAMIDSLRQQFYPRTRQAGRDRKISDSHRKGYSCPMCENGLSEILIYTRQKRNAYSKTYQFFWKTASVITISFTPF